MRAGDLKDQLDLKLGFPQAPEAAPNYPKTLGKDVIAWALGRSTQMGLSAFECTLVRGGNEEAHTLALSVYSTQGPAIIPLDVSNL